jgi:hypothetical protein
MGIVNEMGHLDAAILSRNTKACPDMKGRPPCAQSRRMKTSRLGDGRLQDVRSLRPLSALHDLELDVFSLFQGLESFSLQRGIMYEDIIAALKANEPKSLAIIEPFDRTFCLHKTLLSSTTTPTYVAGPGTQLATHMTNEKKTERRAGWNDGLIGETKSITNPTWLQIAQHLPRRFKSCQAILWPHAGRP